MLLLEANNLSDNKEFWGLMISLATLVVTLATLVATSILNYKSAKAAKRSAEAAERSAASSEESAKFAKESTKSATESVKISERVAETAAQTLSIQREHNIKSVTPILLVEMLSHDEEVSVKLTNNGIGPLIITNLLVTNGVENHYNLIHWMPIHPKGITYWTTYKGGGNGLSIYPGTSIPFLLLGNEDENFPDYVLYRAFVRRNLSKLTIIVQGADIYNRPIQPQTVNLNWFKGFITKWFLENFPEDFNDKFSLTLKPRRVICSVEEWDKKVEKIKRDYIPNKLLEDREKTSPIIWMATK